MTERDVQQMANALLALQNQYVTLLEEDDHEAMSAFQYYNELAEDVAEKTQVSGKYALQILTNPNFLEALSVVSGER